MSETCPAAPSRAAAAVGRSGAHTLSREGSDAPRIPLQAQPPADWLCPPAAPPTVRDPAPHSTLTWTFWTARPGSCASPSTWHDDQGDGTFWSVSCSKCAASGIHDGGGRRHRGPAPPQCLHGCESGCQAAEGAGVHCSRSPEGGGHSSGSLTHADTEPAPSTCALGPATGLQGLCRWCWLPFSSFILQSDYWVSEYSLVGPCKLRSSQ